MSVIYEKNDRIAYITINRPEVNNAIDGKTNNELYEAWSDFCYDSDLLVAILTGSGEKSFSAGGDLKDMENLRKKHRFWT
jgi:dehydration protein DpgD